MYFFNQVQVMHLIENQVHDLQIASSAILTQVVCLSLFKKGQKGATKIVAFKGKRQVDCKTCAEHGKTVTATICFSASEMYMRPMLIFPRKRQNSDYLIGVIEFTNASRENPKLLLLDVHATHVKNLDLIYLAQENGVEIFC